MPWQTTDQTVTPSTNAYVAASDGDGLTFQGSSVSGAKDVGLTFVDQTQPFTASIGFANAPNAWMMGLVPGDIVMMARQGRVHIGGGMATSTPQVMVCAADKSAPSHEGGPQYQRDGIYVRDSINFTADPNMHTGECVRSERGTNPNQYGLDLYTNDAVRLSITKGGYIGIGTQTPSALLEIAGDLKIVGGITFADGSVQNTATLQGPPGPTGPRGPQGPLGPQGQVGPPGKDRIAKSSAICGGATCFGVCHNTLVAEQAGPCVITSETGSCETQIQGQVCCVCT